jgi:transcription termination/antitermination protein NusA
MMDLKVINSVLAQLEEERGIPQAKIIEAIELALATAYKKEYGKKGQIVRAKFDLNTGKTEMFQVKIVVDESTVVMNEDEIPRELKEGEVEIELYNPEKHIMIGDARRIKKDVQLGDEMVFPLENQDDYSRIAAQTAKQVIMQKIREAEKTHIINEFGKKEGEIVSGTVQRMERGNIFIDMGRAPGILPRRKNQSIPI